MALQNNYTGYYEQSSFSTIEQITLAEDLEFESFDDTKGKFFYQMVTPDVNAETSIPRKSTKSSTISTSNYVELVIPANVLIGAVKPKMLTCGIDPKTRCLKPGLKGYKLLYTKEASGGKYLIEKGTKFLIEMLGGSMKVEDGRIISMVPEDIIEDEEELTDGN